MIDRALILGGINFGSERAEGWKLQPASFTAREGAAPVCFDHWLDGSDYVFQDAASWHLIDGIGVIVFHMLHLDYPQECRMYDLAKAGQLYLSFGAAASPDATRAGVARQSRRSFTKGRGRALPSMTIGHWSYVTDPAFPQSPASIIGL